MRQVVISLLLLGFASGCGAIGNSANSSAGSAGSGSAGSAGSSGSSAGSFGLRRDRDTATEVVDQRTLAADGRQLMAHIKDVRFDRTRDGGIIRATGLAPRQGYADGILFGPTDLRPDENGVLRLEFRAREPRYNTPVSTERSREMTVGLFLSDQKLAAARQIIIVGRQNQVILRR